MSKYSDQITQILTEQEGFMPHQTFINKALLQWAELDLFNRDYMPGLHVSLHGRKSSPRLALFRKAEEKITFAYPIRLTRVLKNLGLIPGSSPEIASIVMQKLHREGLEFIGFQTLRPIIGFHGECRTTKFSVPEEFLNASITNPDHVVYDCAGFGLVLLSCSNLDMTVLAEAEVA